MGGRHGGTWRGEGLDKLPFDPILDSATSDDDGGEEEEVRDDQRRC